MMEMIPTVIFYLVSLIVMLMGVINAWAIWRIYLEIATQIMPPKPPTPTV